MTLTTDLPAGSGTNDANTPGRPARPAPAPEPRQRWRLTFAREPVAGDAVGRPALDAWHETLVASGLPVAGLERGGTGRARLALGAPLPANAAGEAELADIWLLARLAGWQVREAIAGSMPAAHTWVAAEDVWLGAPALAGRIVAADWRVAIGGAADADRALLSEAARALLAARSLPRVRLKGGSEKRYDLRPLLADIAIIAPAAAAAAPATVLARIRTRFDPEAGAGRPEEVVAALGQAASCALVVDAVTRERLLLADDLGRAPRR